jgi:hypothetical protein
MILLKLWRQLDSTPATSQNMMTPWNQLLEDMEHVLCHAPIQQIMQNTYPMKLPSEPVLLIPTAYHDQFSEIEIQTLNFLKNVN